MVAGIPITKMIITWETNETNIYLLVRAKCVHCNWVVQAEQSSLNTFLPEEVNRCGESTFQKSLPGKRPPDKRLPTKRPPDKRLPNKRPPDKKPPTKKPTIRKRLP